MNLKRDLTSGVFYTALAKGANILITLAVSAVLARIFTPEQFGIVNICTVVIAFFSVFSDFGMGPAVIQNNDLNKDDLNGIFSLSFWIAIILSGIFASLSSLIVSFYEGGAEFRNILLILTAVLFFNTLNMVPNALLLKAKRFKFIAVRSLTVQVLSGTIAIIAAMSGLGIYALTINPVLSSLAIFCINYSQNPLKPRFIPGKEAIGKVINFSIFQFAFQLINYFSNNVDKLLMGKNLSMTTLGYYDKSYRLMMMPLQNITFVITPVLHPVLAQVQDDRQHMSRAYIKVVKFMAYIGFPLSVLMFFMAEDLILFIFGPQWGASVPCFKILSITVAFQVLLSSTGSVYQALNDTRRLFICGLFEAFTSISGICIGIFVFGSAEWVAAFLCISYLLNFLQAYLTLFCRSFKFGCREFWKTLVKPVILGIILAGILSATSLLVSRISGHFLPLVVYTAIGVSVTLAFVQLTGEYDVKEKIRGFLYRDRGNLSSGMSH